MASSMKDVWRSERPFGRHPNLACLMTLGLRCEKRHKGHRTDSIIECRAHHEPDWTHCFYEKEKIAAYKYMYTYSEKERGRKGMDGIVVVATDGDLPSDRLVMASASHSGSATHVMVNMMCAILCDPIESFPPPGSP